MSNLVFLEPNKINSVPFTTSKVIAEFSGVEHRKLKATIRKHKNTIETFGLLAPYEAESTGGRPEEIWRLNEGQATFIMTLLKNTEIVVEFKRRLVQSFIDMREELHKRQGYRAELKPIRRELTDTIQSITESKWAYKHYTDLAYKQAIGKTAAQMRKERGADKKAKAIDYMTANEIWQVAKLQNQITVLLEMGMDYDQVKMTLGNRLMISRPA